MATRTLPVMASREAAKPSSGSGGLLRSLRSLAMTGCAIVAPCSAGAWQAPAPAPSALDVPFVPQSELLCGGAAVAMVERYWGRRGVSAEEFAALVRPELQGITQSDLADAARERGWRVHVLEATPEDVRSQLGQRAPVIALIQAAPGRYHYVVLIEWTDERVVYHDPAVGPSRKVGVDRFLVKWATTGNWAMVLLPDERLGAGVDSLAPSAAAVSPEPPLRCPPWDTWANEAVQADRLGSATRFLEHAHSVCPGDDLVVRDLAGVLFRQERWSDAARIGDEYVLRRPGDPYGWRLVASSRFLAGDRRSALEAWNHVHLPVVDLVRIDGLERTRYRTVADAVALHPGTVITSARLELARRRVAALPTVRRASVEYQPVPGDRAEVRTAVAERPLVLDGWPWAARGALGALVHEELRLELASPTGSGELLTGRWRWDGARPRLGMQLQVPVTISLPGVLRLEGAWERQRFRLGLVPGDTAVEERRTGVLEFDAWATSRLRSAVGIRLDRWAGGGSSFAGTAAGELRLADDRFVLGVSAVHAVGSGGADQFTTAGARASWRSLAGHDRTVLSGRVGLDLASDGAPLVVLPVVGTDPSEVIPLRAHRLVTDGRIAGANLGRTIVHGGLASDRTLWDLRFATLGLGLFADFAGILSSPATPRDAFYLDAGGGLRVGIGGTGGPTLRIDLARDLLRGGTVLSVGILPAWGIAPLRR